MAAALAATLSSLGAVAVLGSQALEVRTALTDAAAQLENTADHLAAGDLVAARAAATEAARDAEWADGTTSGLLWALASHVPAYGDDVAAVREVSGIAHRLSDVVLRRAVVVVERLDSSGLRGEDGRVELAQLFDVRDYVVAADRELQDLTLRADAIETQSLVEPLGGPVERLQRELSEAAELAAMASDAARVLPPMLGESGERRYLVLFQNNAEIRATGGIPGAVAILTANRGQLRIDMQGTVGDLGFDEDVPTRLTGAERALYGANLVQFGADVGMTPDFPRVAELAGARWQHVQGQRVDGVLATDPVALGYLLEATGPVDLRDGSSLRGENTVQRLLNGVYLTEQDPEAQDAFFAGAARSVFRHVFREPGDLDDMFHAFTRSIQEGRLLAWSARRGEQGVIAGTRVGGTLPGEAIGVFLNDGTAAKMQYYLDNRVDVTPVGCTADGGAELEVAVTLTSTAPEDAALLPSAVVGWRSADGPGPPLPRGHMRLNVHVYAPAGGALGGFRIDGREAPLSLTQHLGHPVGSQTVQLAPGEHHRLTYRVTTGAGRSGPPVLRVTPGVNGSGIGTVGQPMCSGR